MGTSFRHHPLRAELLALYRDVETQFQGATCDQSTDCCRFGITGREPYPTAIERAEIALAVADRGGLPKSRGLPMAEHERRCALLTDVGRCSIYDSRPFGCRTFFCARASSVPEVSRTWVRDVSARLVAISERLLPADAGPRPLSHVVRRGR